MIRLALRKLSQKNYIKILLSVFLFSNIVYAQGFSSADAPKKLNFNTPLYGGVPGRLLLVNDGGKLDQVPELCWDDLTNSLGIGTCDPNTIGSYTPTGSTLQIYHPDNASMYVSTDGGSASYNWYNGAAPANKRMWKLKMSVNSDILKLESIADNGSVVNEVVWFSHDGGTYIKGQLVTESTVQLHDHNTVLGTTACDAVSEKGLFVLRSNGDAGMNCLCVCSETSPGTYEWKKITVSGTCNDSDC